MRENERMKTESTSLHPESLSMVARSVSGQELLDKEMGLLRKTRGITICCLCTGGGSLLSTVSLTVTLPRTQESKYPGH